MVSGPKNIRERQQRWDQRGVLANPANRQGDQRAVGPRDPDRLSLASVDVLACEESAVLARGVQARLAVFTRAVGVAEWRDYQVAPIDSGDRGADVLDHAKELMADPAGPSVGSIDPHGCRSVPQMQAAVTLTTASVAILIRASGTFSTRMSRAP
jgi:hypothetical protein